MRNAALFIAFLCTVTVASADPVHRVRFAVPPIIHVWGDATLRSEAPAMTGALIDDNASGSAEFSIATNTPFEICLSSVGGRSLSSTDLAGAAFTLSIAHEAPNATADGAASLIPSGDTVCVWQARIRTASRSGTPISQAVTFSANWNAARLGALRFTVQPLTERGSAG